MLRLPLAILLLVIAGLDLTTGASSERLAIAGLCVAGVLVVTLALDARQHRHRRPPAAP